MQKLMGSKWPNLIQLEARELTSQALVREETGEPALLRHCHQLRNLSLPWIFFDLFLEPFFMVG
jgi:hypothetical protein